MMGRAVTKNIPFDTLQYAQLLKSQGIENAEGHSAALAAVLLQNVYVKEEVDQMIDAALKEFNLRTREFSDRFSEQTRELGMRFSEQTRELSDRFSERTYALDKRIDLNFKEMESRIDKVGSRIDRLENHIDGQINRAFSRNLYSTLTIMAAFIAVVGAVSASAHYFFIN
jgi:hypothetical protein